MHYLPFLFFCSFYTNFYCFSTEEKSQVTSGISNKIGMDYGVLSNKYWQRREQKDGFISFKQAEILQRNLVSKQKLKFLGLRKCTCSNKEITAKLAD